MQAGMFHDQENENFVGVVPRAYPPSNEGNHGGIARTGISARGDIAPGVWPLQRMKQPWFLREAAAVLGYPQGSHYTILLKFLLFYYRLLHTLYLVLEKRRTQLVQLL